MISACLSGDVDVNGDELMAESWMSNAFRKIGDWTRSWEISYQSFSFDSIKVGTIHFFVLYFKRAAL